MNEREKAIEAWEQEVRQIYESNPMSLFEGAYILKDGTIVAPDGEQKCVGAIVSWDNFVLPMDNVYHNTVKTAITAALNGVNFKADNWRDFTVIKLDIGYWSKGYDILIPQNFIPIIVERNFLGAVFPPILELIEKYDFILILMSGKVRVKSKFVPINQSSIIGRVKKLNGKFVFEDLIKVKPGDVEEGALYVKEYSGDCIRNYSEWCRICGCGYYYMQGHTHLDGIGTRSCGFCDLFVTAYESTSYFGHDYCDCFCHE